MIDAIYTGAGGGICCLAHAHGVGYGVKTGHAELCSRHGVMFVDQPFGDARYDHEAHLALVQRLKPKYATARDLLSEQQAAARGQEWYSLAQTLAWADELAQYATHVILIPKYECLDAIPDRFVIGRPWDEPLSHARYGDRPIHLLGGSWRGQRAEIRSGLNVVSLDNAHIHKLAVAGVFIDEKGVEHKARDAWPGLRANTRWWCLSMSLAALATGVKECEDELRALARVPTP